MSPAAASKKAGRPQIEVDVNIASQLWSAHPDAEEVIRNALATALAATSNLVRKKSEIAIVLTDDASIRTMNREWRGHDKATNVLSFPAPPQPTGGGPLPLGDVVIAYETTAREAEDEDKPFAHHLAHLAVHGFLHLLGYDHESDGDAEAMEGLERAILARLDVPDPYAPHGA